MSRGLTVADITGGLADTPLTDRQKATLHALLTWLGEESAQVEVTTGDDRTRITLWRPNDARCFDDLTPGLLRLFHDMQFVYYSDVDAELFTLQPGRDLLSGRYTYPKRSAV